MGLESALSTALTGLNAAQTTIDVTGNNVANANTVGFKASTVEFATQFSQTQSLGSAPNGDDAGTNPRQTGLGVTVADISPDFSQGTLQVSQNPANLAIQGEGFFVVDGGQGTQLYTRDGEFKTNAQNQLTTAGGQALLGLGVNNDFQIQNTTLQPITIPFGAAAVAQPTTQVTLGGTLTPTGQVATQPSIIQSEVLTDGSIEVPSNTTSTIGLDPPTVSGTTTAASSAAGGVPAGQYMYKIAYVDAAGLQGPVSTAFGGVTTTGTAGVDQSVTLNNLPTPSNGFTSINIYRADNNGQGTYELVGNSTSSTFTDSAASGTTPIDDSALPSGAYSYYVTFFDSANNTESRPTALIGPQSVTAGGRIELDNLPQPAAGSQFDQIKIYRNSLTDPGSFHLLTSTPLPAGTSTVIDSTSDASIANNPLVNLDGPPITFKTDLADVVTRVGNSYVHVFNPNYDPTQPNNGFQTETLTYTGTKGADGSALATQQLAVGGTTTVQDLLTFMQQSSGVQDSSADPLNPIPGQPGATIVNSRLQLTSNIGTENAVGIPIDAFKLSVGGQTTGVNMGFDQTQTANGESAKVDMLVYNSLGEQENVRVTAVLESQSGTGTTWRWFADSSDNSPATGTGIAVGTGELTFDANGQFSSVTNNKLSISLDNGTSSLPISIDFSQVSGLASGTSNLFLSQSNGSAPGTLVSYVISQAGLVTGQFSNGVTRDLGQIQLARFANDQGLVQKGQNLFAQGVNSGVPIVSNPGNEGIGNLVEGAVEQSNTDIGQNLIDLITASTQYQGGAKVISTVQELLNDLLNLSR